MRITGLLLLTGFLFHMFSFARHCWKRKNKLGAIGAMLLALAAFITALIALFFADIEA